ncbi:uncharacterized protein TRIADDRAFT_61599 [Trichoplax adhaerens]|uniref:CUB domain-containing protein n=1 Tax=Trichoplax adhaerens TaxID=10228 RepID=B3SBF7_TRIAD|nr:hypothetical protein TRIADDRAFT_61599 [Trichoplax adhaerens]EDV19949.1 hypothetical protein TRIADDRAFT_61599 [Trichoplax adhaerens]|eukprot:XP_002117539.1 hypothetical protein TRIADDRAFT_61599 [Trichoplax adhaerens]
MAMNLLFFILILSALLWTSCNSVTLTTMPPGALSTNSSNLHARLVDTNATCASYEWYRNTSNGQVVAQQTSHCYSNRCNVTFHQSSGTFTSPYYPLRYMPAFCTYTINAQSGNTITINWQKFNVGVAALFGSCLPDSVTVYDQSTVSPLSKSVLCGNMSQTSSFTSKSNKIIIVFKSISNRHFNGFMANFKTNGLASHQNHHSLATVIPSKNCMAIL